MRQIEGLVAPLTLAIVGGALTADLLRPALSVLPFYIALSLGGMLVSGAVACKQPLKKPRLSAWLARPSGRYFAFCSVTLGAWLLLATATPHVPARGLLAETIPAINQFQAKLLHIETDTSDIAMHIADTAQELHALREAIARLGKRDSLIAKARTPAELYHNAHHYSMRGEVEEAIAAYRDFIEKAPAYLDVHEAYGELLQYVKGQLAVEAEYARLVHRFPVAPTVRLIAIRSTTPTSAARVAALHALIATHPNYAPAHVELARELYQRRWDNLSPDEEEQLAQALTSYVRLENAGHYSRYVLDTAQRDAKIAEIKQIEQEYRNVERFAAQDTVTLQVQQTSGTTSLLFLVKEDEYQEIQYGFDGPQALQSTGFAGFRDMKMGTPRPRSEVQLELPSGSYMVHYRYRNRAGDWSPTYDQQIEVKPFVARARPLPGKLGETTRTVALEFVPYKMGTKQIAAFEYAFNGEELDRTAHPHQDVELTGVPKGSHTVKVRAKFQDGTASRVYRVPVESY